MTFDREKYMKEWEQEYDQMAKELSHILDSMTERQKNKYWKAYSQNEAWDGEIEFQLNAAKRIKRSR